MTSTEEASNTTKELPPKPQIEMSKQTAPKSLTALQNKTGVPTPQLEWTSQGTAQLGRYTPKHHNFGPNHQNQRAEHMPQLNS